jgi:hypothetical protein
LTGLDFSSMTSSYSPVADEGRATVMHSHSSDELAPAGSAISWGAVLAGAAAAAALSLILLMLGVGLGLSSVSPWALDGMGAMAFGISTILWLTFTQVVASGLGGYLAGRLRVTWLQTHRDEVYFRDTAHGFLSWAVSALTAAAVLGSAIGGILSGGVQASAFVAGGAMSAMGSAGMSAQGSKTAMPGLADSALQYGVDSLFRKPSAASPDRRDTGAISSATSDVIPSPIPSTAALKDSVSQVAEVVQIFLYNREATALPVGDLRYVADVVAQRSGVSAVEAEQRVNELFSRLQAQWREAQAFAKDATDVARKTSAYGALWLFVSLLSGAFAASFAATLGGKQRDAS